MVDEIVIATTTNEEDDLLSNVFGDLGCKVFRGSENEVLSRYYHAATHYEASVIVRITGDCPIIDPILVDHVISKFHEGRVDCTGNINPLTYPDGLDVEVFSFSALRKAFLEAKSQREREHVTPFIRESEIFAKYNVTGSVDISDMRWTVYEPSDFIVIENVFDNFFPRVEFAWEDVLRLCKDKPLLFTANCGVLRNMGGNLTTGQKFWGRAKRVISGGNMLLSKRPEMCCRITGQPTSSAPRGVRCGIWKVSVIGIGQ